jgi:hypothetical protein
MLFVSNGSTLGKIEDYYNYMNKLIKSGLTIDPLAVQILDNMDNLMDIIDTNKPADKKDKKYFSFDPLYNSLEKSRKIPATYLCTSQEMDITNYLRSGIADVYLKDRGGLGDDDFHYYTYLTERTRSPYLTKENYELIYAYYKLIQAKCLHIENKSEDVFYKGYSIDMKKLYIISKPKALEIGYELLKDASIKHKFSLSSLKSVSALDIIKFCIDEKYLLDHKLIKQSIKRMEYNKMKILNKVKKEFNGSGSIWKFICSSETLYLDELRFIADINGIENTGMLTKQDLCSELEKLSTGKKNTVVASCENESDITGDDIKDIPAEYFFSYKENGRAYCTDIRSAYANIKAGNNKNPYTNVEIPKETRDKIVDLYEADIKPEEEAKPTLTQLLANFSSKIPYLNSVDLYKNATREQLETFLDILLRYPTYEQVKMEGWKEGTLEDDKYILINNTLLNRNFDDFKYQLREDYNKIFTGLARPVLLTIEEMIKKISPELNPDDYINATRREVFEFLEVLEYESDSNIVEDLKDDYEDDSVTDEEFKYSTILYIYVHIFVGDEIDEENRNKVIEIYNRGFTF